MKKTDCQKIYFYMMLSIIIAFIIIAIHDVYYFHGILIFAIIFLAFSYLEKSLAYKEIQNIYKQKEKFLESVTKHSPDLIAYKDLNFNYVLYSNMAKRIITLNNVDTTKNFTDYDIIDKKEADVLRKNEEEALKTGKNTRCILRNVFPGKTHRIYDCVSCPIIENDNVIGVLSIARNITKSESLKKQYLEEKNKLTAIFENLPIITFLRDREGNLIHGNRKLYELLNIDYKPQNAELAKKRYAEYFTNTPGISIEDNVIIEKGISFSYERRLDFGTGTSFWYRIHKSPFYNDHNEIIGIVVCAENIEAEKRAVLEQETFVATLSHDLKTPTIAQMRSLEMLMDKTFGELNKEQEEMIGLTLSSCKYMFEMVSMILYTYKHQHGKMKLNSEAFNLMTLAEDICKEMKYFAEEKNIKMNVISQTDNNEIIADRLQMKRVITNILNNSINYAYNDTGIDISINQAESSVIEVLIKNKGPHIPETFMKGIFNKYETYPFKFNKVGMGLGLYISKKIIETHLGEMIHESKNGENTFGFRINKNFLSEEYVKLLNSSMEMAKS